jgi:hypothetical protein
MSQSDEMAEELGEAFMAPVPNRSPRRQKAMPWQPKLGPIGTQVLLNRTDDTKFMYGERGSLKTGISLHDLITHCYQDFDPRKLAPLAVICTIVRGSATEGGAWEKINTLYLPEWFDGIGLEFTEPKMDDQKNRYIFVANKAGSWSRVVLKSIPHGESIRGRLKGVEPSYFFFDEITEADDPDYYIIPSQGLRRPTGGPRQFVCSGNPPPEGTDHWTWRVMCQRTGEIGKDGKPTVLEPEIPNGGGRLIGTPPKVAVYHVPLSENVYWTEQEKTDYRQKLMQEARLDPTAEDRVIKGLWTPKPRGHGLFKSYFSPQIHVKPPDGFARGLGLLPVAGYPIILGYDLGQVYSSVTFVQRLPTKDAIIWTAFDEADHLGERILYRNLAREIIRRMKHWRKVPLPTNNGNAYPFQFINITDESAINQWRPGGEGSFDAWEFEREFNKYAEQDGLKKMKLIGCPKPSGSVAMRVMMLQSKLQQDEFFVSARCVNTKNMLLNLEAEKEDADKPRRTKWLHKFDSLTYPMLKLEMTGGRLLVGTGDGVAPGIIRCGVST